MRTADGSMCLSCVDSGEGDHRPGCPRSCKAVACLEAEGRGNSISNFEEENIETGSTARSSCKLSWSAHGRLSAKIDSRFLEVLEGLPSDTELCCIPVTQAGSGSRNGASATGRNKGGLPR